MFRHEEFLGNEVSKPMAEIWSREYPLSLLLGLVCGMMGIKGGGDPCDFIILDVSLGVSFEDGFSVFVSLTTCLFS